MHRQFLIAIRLCESALRDLFCRLRTQTWNHDRANAAAGPASISKSGEWNNFRSSLSFGERRVAQDIWLVFSAGHETRLSCDLPDQSFAVGGIHYGFDEHETPEPKC